MDNCFLGKQNKAESYYTRGRHSNCDTIYISQNYFELPRQTVRENSNIIVLFPQDAKNINHVHADHCSDISIDENENEIKMRVIIHEGDIAIVIRYTSLKITV